MEIEDRELVFERAFDLEALSSFSCGVKEIDFMIHRKSGGLREFIACNNCEPYIVFHNNRAVAVFVFSKSIYETADGNREATELDFIAVLDEYRNRGIGRTIINAIAINSVQNGRIFLTVGAFVNKHYSAAGFYQKCGFEQSDERQGNIIPMFKEL